LDRPQPGRSRAAGFVRHAAFGLAFGAAVGLASIPGALIIRGDIDQRLGFALLLFAAGASAAGLVSSWLLGRRLRSRPRTARLAAAIIVLTFFTCLFCSFFLYLQYISYFAAYWERAFTSGWFESVIFTGAGVTFFFVSLALPMMLPVGLPVLLAGAFVLSRPTAPLAR
jgi:hypothetical protein